MHSNSYFLNLPTQHSFSCLAPNASTDGISQYMLQVPTLHSFAISNTQYSVHYAHLTSMHSVLDRASINAFHSVYAFEPARHVLVYKPVTKKVRTVPTAMPAEYRVVCQLSTDPLAGLPPLPSHPPEFCPGTCFMHECMDKLDLNPAKWLWPEELKLVQWLMHAHKRAFAWNTSTFPFFARSHLLPNKSRTSVTTLLLPAHSSLIVMLFHCHILCQCTACQKLHSSIIMSSTSALLANTSALLLSCLPSVYCLPIPAYRDFHILHQCTT
jgi:hypothetical protein